MTNNQRLKHLQELDNAGIRSVAENRSCAHPFNPHERRMFISGFCKGLKAALHGERSLKRADVRRAQQKHGDEAWSTGFSEGVKYVPVNHVSSGAIMGRFTSPVPNIVELTKFEARRLGLKVRPTLDEVLTARIR